MLVFAYNSKGVTLRRRGLLDEAEQCHHLALDLCNERGIPTGLAAAYASLGAFGVIPAGDYLASRGYCCQRRGWGREWPARHVGALAPVCQ